METRLIRQMLPLLLHAYAVKEACNLATYSDSGSCVLAAVVFTIMEDVMELSTIEEAQGVFGYLESRIHKLRQVSRSARRPLADPSKTMSWPH